MGGWRGGGGGGGEGSKLWPPFSVTREPCSSLTGAESEATGSVLLPFCPSGTRLLTEGEFNVFLSRPSLESIPQTAGDLFA